MQISKKYRSKYIRYIIKDKNYSAKRLEVISGKMVHWVLSKSNVTTIREREFCTKMAEMYHKRCIWYINKIRFYENT